MSCPCKLADHHGRFCHSCLRCDSAQSTTMATTQGSGYTASPKLFCYNPLRDDHECIRLLRILPARSGDTVECQLDEVETENCPPFEALSYVWGARSASDPIIRVSGSNFQVTRNCYDAIVHLRGTETPRVVWIDAICIDQDNAQEKNAQVERLGAVYTRAQRTIIWLGVYERPIPFSGRLDDVTVIWMLQRAWWTRVWIIQELSLSRTPVLLVGRHEIPWVNLEAGINEFFGSNQSGQWIALSRVRHINTGGPFSSRIIQRAEALMDMRRVIRGTNHAENMGLLELLILFQDYQSGRRRDKVFSLLNIARDRCGIRADYSEGGADNKAAEIFRTAAVRIIRTYKHVNILGQVYRSDAVRKPLEVHLPTWVPHWNRGENLTLGGKDADPGWHVERQNKHPDLIVEPSLAHMVFDDDRPRASGLRTELTPLELDRMTSPDLPLFGLRLPGIVIDTIVVVGSLLPPLILEVETAFPQQSVQSMDSWLSAPGVIWSANQLKERKEATVSELKKRAYVYGEIITVLREWYTLAVDTNYNDDEVQDSVSCSPTLPSSPPPPAQSPRQRRFQRFLASMARGNDVEMPSEKDWDVVFGSRHSVGDRLWSFLGRMFFKYLVPEAKDDDENVQLGKQIIPLILGHLHRFGRLLHVFQHAFNFRLARTRRGYLALAPKLAAPGDDLALLATAGSPYVVRSASPNRADGYERCLELVGWCYAPGLMDGQRWKDENVTDIILV